MAIEDKLKYTIELAVKKFNEAHSAITYISKDLAMLSNISSKGVENVRKLEHAYATSFKNVKDQFVSLRDVAESVYAWQTKSWLRMGDLPQNFITGLTQLQNKLAVFGKKESIEGIKLLSDAFRDIPEVAHDAIAAMEKGDYSKLQRLTKFVPEDVGLQIQELITKLKMLEGPQDKNTRLMVAFGKVSANVTSIITNTFQELVYMFEGDINDALNSFKNTFVQIVEWIKTNRDWIGAMLKSVWEGLKQIGSFLGSVASVFIGWGGYFLKAFKDAPPWIKECVKWLAVMYISLKLITASSILNGLGSIFTGGRGIMGQGGGIANWLGGGTLRGTGGLFGQGGMGTAGGLAIGARVLAPSIAAGAAGAAGSQFGDWTGRAIGKKTGGERGEKIGSWVGSIGGGAAAGALIGSVIPVLGTALGGLIGAGVGAAAKLWDLKKAAEESAQAQRETASAERATKAQTFAGSSGMSKIIADIGGSYQGKYQAAFDEAVELNKKTIEENKGKTPGEQKGLLDANRWAADKLSESGEILEEIRYKMKAAMPEIEKMNDDELKAIIKSYGAEGKVIEAGATGAQKEFAKKTEKEKDPYGVQAAQTNIKRYSEFADDAISSVEALNSEMETGGVTTERINELNERRAKTMEYLNKIEQNVGKVRADYQKEYYNEVKKIEAGTGGYAGLNEAKKEEAKLHQLEMMTKRITEADQAHADILAKKVKLREAALLPFEREIEMTEKRIELARIDTQMAEAVYGTAAMAFEAVKKTVAELENKRRTQQAELQEAIKLRQEAEATGGDSRAALAKELDLRAAVKRTTLEQLQLLKQVRDGYLDAVQAQAFGLGTFNKLLITQEENVGLADVGNMKRRNFLTGMANAEGNIAGRRWSAYGGMTGAGGGYYGSENLRRDQNVLMERMNPQQRALSYGNVNQEVLENMLTGATPGLISAEKQAEVASRAGMGGNQAALRGMASGIPSPSGGMAGGSKGPASSAGTTADDVKGSLDSLVTSAQRVRSAVLGSINEYEGRPNPTAPGSNVVTDSP